MDSSKRYTHENPYLKGNGNPWNLPGISGEGQSIVRTIHCAEDILFLKCHYKGNTTEQVPVT